eukprot:CAMPEP_0113544398 /NCGR_PEP_ID=MMETSP0015_2-20120614/10687_1 /TAXON_ID=2838 /ORGANISM="Odontella" /LENGTH=268 /DNA_ID=CAMNT_0000444655 /DNA_START=29 /DNA_END=835 /DNA_ORIENTATION=- /assembly_acc=CAM_ASM_000160
MTSVAKVVSVLAIASLAFGQDYGSQDYGGDYGGDYQDYAGDYGQQDNLYHDYAMKQEDKATGKAGGGGIGKLVAASAAGWLVGAKVHTKRATKKMKEKHMKEQKNLYTQYYNDVYKLQESNAELAYVVEQLQANLQQVEQEREMEAIQRDYDEFKQPDVDGDDRISRAEFNMYVNNYLKNYPGLAEKDYPKFEDFDHDSDGYVGFQEYSQQMKLQAQQAEADQRRAQQSGSGSQQAAAKQKVHALKGLAGESKQTDNFNDLYANYRKY